MNKEVSGMNNGKLELTGEMIKQLDTIDNATYNVCCIFLNISEKERETSFPWNMEILAGVREAIADVLLQYGKAVCYPYITYERGEEKMCQKEDCYCIRCIRESVL